MNFPKPGRAAFLGASVVGLLLPATVARATNYWKNGVVTGDWNTGNNWSATSAAGVDNAGAPTLGEAVNIVLTDGLAHTVTYDVSAPSLGLLSIDAGPSLAMATLSMPSNFNLQANGIFVGGYSGAGVTTGRGALNQSAGTVATNAGWDLVVGYGANSTGAYTLSGGALVANQSEYIGLSGIGIFSHSGGTNTIKASAVGSFVTGVNAGSTGTYNLGGTGALVVNAHEYIGYGGTGIFNQTGGTHTISPGHELYLGFNASGAGAYTLSGGTLTVPAVFVGYANTGLPSDFFIAGAGSTVNATTSFVVGRAGRGTLTLADGGTLAIGNGTLPLLVGTVTGSNGAVNIGDGGAAGVLEASAVAFGLSGELRFNHTGNLTFATPITGPGLVYKFGAGTTALSAINSYTGKTLVEGGTLAISADANLGTPPGSFKADQLHFTGGTLRATQSFTMAATRGIEFSSSGGTIEVDATKTLTYLNNLDLFGGSMTKTGAGTLAAPNLVIGNTASSSLVVTGGGTLAITGDSYIAAASNVNASVTVSGPGTTWTTTSLHVGEVGTGTLEIINGGTLATASSSRINYASSARATATVRGAGSTWNVGADLVVGNGGDGTLNVEDQALVHVAGELFINLGIVNLSGGTLRFNGYNRAASGTFNFNSGTIQLAGDRSVGTDAAVKDLFGAAPIIPAGKGLTVEGTATLLTNVTLDGGTFTVSNLINGANLLLNRGTLNVTNQAVTIGPSGILGSTLDLASGMTVNSTLGIQNQGLVTGDGQLGGTFTNAAGGELRGEPGRSLKLTGSGNTNAGQINLLGGLVEFTQDLANNAGGFISGNGSLIVRNGLLNNGTMNFSGSANVFGDTTNAAGGKVISSGGGPTTFFDDVTNQGEIRTSAGSFTVFFGSVAGAGTFTGLGTVNFEGDLKPGNSAAAVQFAGDVAFGPDAALQIELGGAAAGSQYDFLDVAGELTLGGTLAVSLIDAGAGQFAPAAGDSFDILDWGSLSGTFTSIDLPILDGLQWDTSQLYTDGVLSVASPFLEADFNENGAVNAADLALWKAGFGTSANATHLQGDASGDEDVDGADFLVWQRQLGSPPSAVSANAPAPEPASVALALAPLAALPLRRRRQPLSPGLRPGVA